MAKPPVPQDNPAKPARTSSSRDIERFIGAAGSLAPQRAATGRLLFALDATLSRQPTWDLACALQAEMFGALPRNGSLAVQLLYFRGADECRASRWVTEAPELARLMTGIDCRGGRTQIRKVFSHARAEHGRQRLHAVVYVGDAVEEDVEALAETAAQLGLAGCPLFLFQEGRDAQVAAAFREFARLSKGAYARFDANASQELAALLRAVAAYASGGRDLLRLQKTATATALLQQLP